MALTEKSEFQNTTDGHLGVVTIEPGGKPRGIAVAPGENIWLSEDEQVLTANAPRKAEDNPFVNGSLKLITKAQDIGNRRPIGTEEVSEPDEQKESAPSEDETKKKKEAERLAKGQKQADMGVRPAEEVGGTILPSGTPVAGQRAPGEEVGVPDAAGKPAPKPAEDTKLDTDTDSEKPKSDKPKSK